MRNQSKPKKKMLSVSNDKKQNRSNSIVALKKPQKILKKNNIVENDIISPKTITYKKAMEKHTSIDSDSSIHKDSCTENQNRSSITPIKTSKTNYDINSFRKILDDYDFLKEENTILKTLVDKEKQKSQKLESKLIASQPKINASNKELEMIKEKNNGLENELEMLKTKTNSTIIKYKERVVQMIQLFKKNVSKIGNLAKLIEKEVTNKTPSKELLMKDFTLALESFYKVINNPKVINMFEKEESELFSEAPDETDYSHFEIIKRLEKKCRKLEKEKCQHSEASEKYLLKYNDLKVTFEETSKQLGELKKNKQELDKNYSIIIEENNKLKFNITNMKEKISDYEDKIIGMINEAQLKSSKLDHLESKKMTPNATNNNFNNTRANSIIKENDEATNHQDISETRLKLNQYKDYLNNSNRSFKKSYKDVISSNSDINVFSSNEEVNVNKKQFFNSPSEVNMSKTSSLKHDIDYLDNEINQLQGKLRSMIDIKK